MPKITRWHLKTGLICFIVALFLAVCFRLQPILQLSEHIQSFRPIYYHVLMVGWITQIIIGVSIWMFPRHSRESPRGSEMLDWSTYYCLNVGLVLRMIAEPFINIYPSRLLAYLILFSGFLQWFAALMYATNIWNRIKLK